MSILTVTVGYPTGYVSALLPKQILSLTMRSIFISQSINFKNFKTKKVRNFSATRNHILRLKKSCSFSYLTGYCTEVKLLQPVPLVNDGIMPGIMKAKFYIASVQLYR